MSRTWPYLAVMSELQVLGEFDGTGSGDVAVRLEHVHGEHVTREERTTNELRKHIEGD